MIREATRLDVPRCVEMGRRFWRTTGYSTLITENPAQMAAIGERLIAGPDSVLLVDQRTTGEIIAMIGVLIFQHHLSGQRTAGELFFWVEPEHRGRGVWLLTAAENWARHHGAVLMQMIEPTNVDDVGDLYERLGYAEIEIGWMRPL